MFSKTNLRSRLENLKNQQNNIVGTIFSNLFQSINLFAGPIPLLYCLLSMSMFYQVVGAVKCPKIKKHAGIKLRPINKAKEPFMPNDMIIYSCESAEFTQTIKCLDDGRWSDDPYCPDPVNNTCPDLGTIPHGSYNSSGPPYKVGVVLAFRCENEYQPQMIPSTTVQSSATTLPATITTTSTATKSMSQIESAALRSNLNISLDSETTPLRYNLTGHRQLRCLPSSKWNHPMPTCTPIIPEPPSNIGFVLASVVLILIPILIMATVFHLFMRWRKRQQQRERWKQYFTDYKYRHSKTSITFGNRPNPSTTIPVTDL